MATDGNPLTLEMIDDQLPQKSTADEGKLQKMKFFETMVCLYVIITTCSGVSTQSYICSLHIPSLC